MANLSTENLIKCISEKDKYKNTAIYIKQVQLENQNVYPIINQALHNILVTNNLSPTIKLFGLRFFKDLFISAQFHLVDNLHQSIFKAILKVCQFDKDNQNKAKRGSSYFQQAQKRVKQKDIQKVSYSYVLFATQLIYVMGTWYTVDEDNQKTQYCEIFQKLKKVGVPFPSNDKQLKFLKAQQKQSFNKNYKEWVDKLPQIQQVQQDGDQKQNNNQKSRKQFKSIKSSKQIPEKQNIETKIKQRQLNVIQKQKEIKNTFQQNAQKKQIQNLQRQKDQLMRNKKQMQEKINKLEQQNQNYKAKLQQSIKSTNASLEIQRNKSLQLQVKYKQLENQLRKQKNNQKYAQIKIKSQNQQLQKKYQQLQTKFKSLQSKNFNLQNKDTSIQKKFILLEKQHDKSILKINELKMENQQLMHEKSKKQHLIKQLNEEIQNIKQNATVLQNKIKLFEVQRLAQLNSSKQTGAKIQNIQTQLSVSKLGYKIDQNLQEKIYCQKCKDKQSKINQLENQIQLIVKNYTQKILQIKQKNKKAQQQNDQLKSENKKINAFLIQMKNKQDFPQSNKNTKSQEKQIKIVDFKQNIKSFQDKQQKILKKSNSMSAYLQQRTQINQRIPFNHSVMNNNKIPTQSNQRQMTVHEEKVRISSLGKTQKSSQKLRQRRQRYSSGKNFHFAPDQLNKISYSNNSYGNLLGLNKRQNQINLLRKNEDINMFQKKSALHLNINRKSQLQETLEPNPLIHTRIPYIKDYFMFPYQSSTNQKKIFESLCLHPQYRTRQPFFINRLIQIKILNKIQQQLSTYTFQIMNISYNKLKIKILSCHDQFKIVGEKQRVIQSNCKVEYQIQTKVKDLNLRYPVVSLIVNQEIKESLGGFNAKRQSTVLNVPLPLTLLQFSEFKAIKPQFLQLDQSKLKYFQSQLFQLNKKINSAQNRISKLSFIQNLKFNSNKKNSLDKQPLNLTWNGTISHKFIQNIEAYVQITQTQNKAKLLFGFRDYDRLSQNFAKVMIQVITFLLSSN